MRKTMAVTHADLAPSRRRSDLGSKTGAMVMVVTILCGLFCFILCLTAEATRSQVIWEKRNGKDKYECLYSGSGKIPLLCGSVAFLGLAIGMVVKHVYILISITNSPPSALLTWEPDFAPSKPLTFQAAFFFFTTWICFAIGEILMLIGLSVESGHLENWSSPRPNCVIIREGLFSTAGVFALVTVFLGTGLYLTALRAQKLSQDVENVRREVIEASTLYISPPRSPNIATIPRENPISREDRNDMQFFTYSLPFSKQSNFV